MTKSWSKYIQNKILNSEFHYITRAKAEDLVFLNYHIIMNDAGLFIINSNVSILSNSSEKKNQVWRSIVKKFDLKIKTFEKSYVWKTINVKNRMIKIANRLDIKSKCKYVNVKKSRKLIIEKQIERFHKNVNNIILHLLDLNSFLANIRALIKKIMIIIINDWNIQFFVSQTTLKKRKKETKNNQDSNQSEWMILYKNKFKKIACGWNWSITIEKRSRLLYLYNYVCCFW